MKLLTKASKTPKMNIFSWHAIEKSFVKIFSGSSGILYWLETCSDRSGLSIAPTFDRFGRVHVKKDTIEKRWTTIAPIPSLKKRTIVNQNFGESLSCPKGSLIQIWCLLYIWIKNSKAFVTERPFWHDLRSYYPTGR